MIIGVTGIFGSGKTTIAEEFSKRGYKTINVDKVGHKLLNRKDIKKKILDEFGNVLTKGKVDRRKLKDIVFYDHKKLVRLNKIIHPYLIKEVKSQIKASKKAVVDAALLIELGLHRYVDDVIVVKISKANAVKRVLNKGKYTKQEVENILRSQMPQAKKIVHADFVIDNNKSISKVNAQVAGVCAKLS